MKKLLLFVLVGLLFVPVLASADQVLASSHAGLKYVCLPNNTPTVGACTPDGGQGTTVAITPNPAWAPAFAGSEWISYAQTGSPDVGTPNGTMMEVLDTVFVPFDVSAVNLKVMADDTTFVVLTTNPAFYFPAALDAGNTYQTCSDVTIGCLAGTAGDFNIPVTPGLPLNLYFGVYQQAGSSFGLDYVVTPVPEPSSLILAGSGLVSLLFRRKFRK